MSLRRVLPLLAILTFAAVMVFMAPLPQSQAYHDFADQRELIPHVPNTLNVLSNVPFLIAAVMGLRAAGQRSRFVSRLERTDAITFFLGVALTFLGSSIYHWSPSDATLSYDRLGMTVAFMAFLAMVWHEHVSDSRWMLPLLQLIGIGSIAWWVARNDLRPYAWVQFFPILLIVLILIAQKPGYSGERQTFIVMFVAYAAAKAFEAGDGIVYRAAHGIVSGHTLKHLAAAAAPAVVARWIATREPLKR